MTVIFRTAGAWGSGKGSNLTPAEVDGNFYDHEQRIASIENDPPEAVSIASIEVVGNQLLITLSDSSTQGPFTLPSATWTWKGEWTPTTVYFALDVFSYHGAVYLVRLSHTSEATFNPDEDLGGGFLYARLLAQPQQPYDVGMFYAYGVPGDGSALLQHVAARAFAIPADFGNSVAFLRVTTKTENLAFPIYRNADLIGHIEFNVGESLESGGTGQFGTFVPLAPPADLSFSRLDRLLILAPDVADDLAAGLSVTFAATSDPA